MSRQPWGSPSADRVDQVALTSRLCFQLLVLVRGGLGGRGWGGGEGGGEKMFCRLRFLSWPLFLGYSLLRS